MTKLLSKRALFGGTFDPPHKAHHDLLREIQQLYQFEKILIVPSRFSSEKEIKAPYEKRLQWCLEVFAENYFEVSDYEKLASSTRFGRDVFYHHRTFAPETSYTWILGQDQWERLPYWNLIDEYVADLHWLVIPRALVPTQEFGILSRRFSTTSTSYRWAQIRGLPEIASSAIRADLNRRQEWIPQEIRQDVIDTYRSLEQQDQREKP